MRRTSLRGRLFMMVVLVTIPVFAIHEAIEIRGAIDTITEHASADIEDVGAAIVPLLKSALIVGDLATARETLDNIMRNGQFHALRLLDADGRGLLVEGGPAPVPTAGQPPDWFATLLDLHFAAGRFPIDVGGTRYGVLVVEPASRILAADIWERVWTAVAIWLATLAISLAMLHFTLRRDLKPLDDLAEAARCLGDGDLDRRAPVSGVPELAATAIAFNRMADKLAGERERLEERVRQATRELENLVTRIPAGVYKLRISPDDDMHFDYVSPHWLDLLELDAETIARNPWAPLSCLHPDEVEGFVRAFDEAKAAPSRFAWEGRLRDGMRARWLRIEATPTPLDDGGVLWEGIQYDVTEQRQVGNLLQSIIDVVDEGLLLIDGAGQVMRANRRFQQIWNIPDALMEAGEDERLLTYVLEQLTDPQGFLAEVRRLYPIDETSWALIEFKDGRVLERYTCPAQTEKGRARLWAFRDITERRRIERDLQLMSQAVAHASEAFLVCNNQYRVQYVNPSFERLFGYTLAEIRGQPIAVLMPEEPEQASANPVVLDEFSGERLRRAKDGRLIPVLLKVSTIAADNGAQAGFVGTMTDLSAFKATEAALRDALRERDNLVARIPAGVYKLRRTRDGEIRFDYVSPRWCQLLEIEADEVYRNPAAPFTRIHPDDIDAFRSQQAAALADMMPFFWEGRLRDGMRVRWLRIESAPTLLGNGDVLWEGIQYDITATKEHEQELDRIAHYDPLTGVPNRVLLADRLGQAIAQARRNNTQLAVCYLDLDSFKPVNDHLGHEAGDALLVEIARRLTASLRGGDTVARIGGDEFVLLFSGIARMDEYETTLGRVLKLISMPVDIQGQVVSVSASIGIALYPKDDADPDLLLRHADQAMYQAKQAGRNKYIFFDPDQEDAARWHREVLRQIETGLAGGEFELYYQPKVDMRRGTVAGFEALARWRHPDRGLLSPEAFLPLIQEHDLVVRFGEWVIEQALTRLSAWLGQGHALTVSVNIAPHHLQRGDFIDRLRLGLAGHPGLPPGSLEIEIIETAALSDTARIARLIEGCRRLGVTFALDDFGTGYSSLTYLKNLPAQTLKIDQSFVRDMLDDANDLAIVEGVIELSEIFNREVVAVGVESIEHGLLLLNMGCELVQGYGIANPMSADDVEAWLRAWHPDPAWRSLAGRRWPRDDRPLIIVQHHHRDWVERLAAYVAGAADSPPEPDAGRCRFGQWHADGGRQRYGSLPEFAALDEAHARIHRLGAELAGLADQGRREEAQARLPELYGLRDGLLNRLRSLMAAAGGTPGP